MHIIKQQISEQSHQILVINKTPKRVKLGLREQSVLDAAPPATDIAGAQQPYVTNTQTGKQSFMGLEIVRVDLPSCLEVGG